MRRHDACRGEEERGEGEWRGGEGEGQGGVEEEVEEVGEGQRHGEPGGPVDGWHDPLAGERASEPG